MPEVSSSLKVGSLVDGKYKILNEIGHGGMSVVYLAIVERANQTWAIKEVRKNGATKEDIVQQGLVAEMNILKKLNHPHLPRIIDIIDHNDSFLIVMDYIEGIDLDKKLRDGPQKWDDVVEWSKQLCDVFAYLHSRKPPIIYRDMKPGNVKLKPDGNVVLFDFGTAREYKSYKAGDDTTCLGTRGYASPEQYGGMGQTDARSDIYCLGATMYHLVTGKLPGGPPNYVISPIRSICPWLPKTGKEGNCVRGLEYIISKCLQQNPADRYQNCAELMYDLENIDRITADFVNSQKKKLKTWIVCCAFSVVFALSGLGFGIASNKTTDNNYNAYIQNFVEKYSTSLDRSENSSDYLLLRDYISKAIKLKPESTEAWVYLARLFNGDNNVSDLEISYVNSLEATYREELKKSKDSSRFYYEWAQDILFYKDGVGDTGGDASKYINEVFNSESSSLVCESYAPENVSEEKNYDLYIKAVSQSQAEQMSKFVNTLQKILTVQSSSKNNTSITKTGGYTSSDYYNDIVSLYNYASNNGKYLDSDGNSYGLTEDSSVGIASFKLKVSIFNFILNELEKNKIMIIDADSTKEAEINELVRQIGIDASQLKQSIGNEKYKAVKTIFDSIESKVSTIFGIDINANQEVQ